MDLTNVLRLDDRLITVVKQVRAIYSAVDPLTNDRLYEHGLSHVGRVVRNALIASSEERLSQPDVTMVVAAALCHDLGYLTNSENHILASVQSALPLLKDAAFSTIEIDEIASIIMAHSSTGKAPSSLAEKILRVADKCDLLGYDGSVRQILLHSRQFADRDELCVNLLAESEQLHQGLQEIGVAREMTRNCWIETQTLLTEVVRRGFVLDDTKTG